MNMLTVRPITALLLTVMVLAAGVATAQPPSSGPILSLTATTANVVGAPDSIRIDLLRWSTDAERDQLLAAWNMTPRKGRGGRGVGVADPASADGDPFAAFGARSGRSGRGGGDAPPPTPEGTLARALKQATTVGYLWSSELAGYALRYAGKVTGPDGVERTILITDRRLGAANELWKPVGSGTPTTYDFSVIELRMNSQGEGEGKISLLGKVTPDGAAEMVVPENYDALPVFLKNLKRRMTGAGLASAANSEVADRAMKGDKAAVRALVRQKANVNAPQIDGTTALHWAVQASDMETAALLIRAGANVSAANRAGATPLLLASINGNAAMIEELVKAGADPNAPLTKFGDTALMMTAKTGKPDAVKMLLEHGAQVNAQESWGDTTALMWAVSEKHPDVVKLLIDHGADVNAKSKFVPSASGRGFEGTTPVAAKPNQPPEELASGSLTPLMFAAREDDMESARLLVAAGADVNAIGGDGKDALSLAIFNGSYDVASLLIDSHAKVNQPDAQRFTPLFWAVDRRNMETAPNFPWMVTTDPLPLIHKLLDAGADPNALINSTPRARMREGSPRIVFATALMRAAFSGDIDLVKLLIAHGADPHIESKDRETSLMAACGTGFINGYHKQRSSGERLEAVKLLIDLGADVNAADSYGITPLMVAANLGDVPVIKYLIDKGADLSAHDLGKKNDGAFGSSIEPLMPIDYAIGVGTFVPNNAVIMHKEAVQLISDEMKQRGIKHTTSECTLRGFTCSGANVDPKTATPAEIAKVRKIQIGYQVDGITGGLAVKDKNNDKDKSQK